MNEMEIKKEQLAKMVKFGLIGLFCAVAAPVAWMAVTGLAGMLAAMGVAAVGYNLAPVVALKLTNYKYRALDAERVDHIAKVKDAAAENPVETLQLDYNSQERAINDFASGITEFRTEVKNYADIVKEFEKSYPEDAEQGREQLQLMRDSLKDREEIYANLQHDLADYAKTIKKTQALWDLAIATQKVNKLAGLNTGDVFAKIKVTAAVDSVRAKLNQSFAQMETAKMVNRRPAVQNLIANEASPALIVNATVTQKVTV